MKRSLTRCAIIALTFAWALPAWSASRTLGSAELLANDIETQPNELHASGAALLHDGPLYVRAQSISVTLNGEGAVVSARAAGNARVSFGSVYAVAESATLNSTTGQVSLLGSVAVFRGQEQVRGNQAWIEADGSVRVERASGTLTLPERHRK